LKEDETMGKTGTIIASTVAILLMGVIGFFKCTPGGRS
jgi:hypothetical protein